jgi:cytoskeleton protein RodZ
MIESRSDTATPAGATPGRMLAAARAAAGLGVDEVAVRLKYSVRYIEAMEADRFDALPVGTIARGMVRSYARLVGLDPAPLLALLGPQLDRTPQTVQPVDMAVPFNTAPRRGSMAYLVPSVIVIVIVAALAVEWWLPSSAPPPPAPARQAPAVAATPPAPPAEVATVTTPLSPPAAPPAAKAPASKAAPAPAAVPAAEHAPDAAPATKVVELEFTEECWVEARDGNGQVIFSQLNAPDTRRRVVGVPPISLHIGNAGGVLVRFNNADISLAPYTREGVARVTLQ